MMTFKGNAFVLVAAIVGLINTGLPQAWAMGGSPTQQPGDANNIALVKARPVTESDRNVYIRYRHKVDPYAINDETSLQAEAMLFVNDTLVEMALKQCPGGSDIESAGFRVNGTIPFQGVDGEFYYYVFSVDRSALHKQLQAHCAKN